jgi:hypothetical protein
MFGTDVALVFNQVSAFLTMLVAFQRYVSVCLPHRAKRLCTVRVVNTVTIISYVTAFLLYLPNFLTRRVIIGEDGRFTVTEAQVMRTSAYQIGYMSVTISLLAYFLPLGSLGFMSIKTLLNLNSASTVAQSQERPDAFHGRHRHPLRHLPIVYRHHENPDVGLCPLCRVGKMPGCS